jgi:hypothetical protein
METLAQSVSTWAPTTTPAATTPLVWALAGNGMGIADKTIGSRRQMQTSLSFMF